MNICTIVARNYIPHARVLADSFRSIHPEGTCTVLFVDDPEGFVDFSAEPFEILQLWDVGLPDAERMAASYDVVELSTAVKPWLLRHLLERPNVDAVTYLDPDIQVFGSLEEIELRARDHEVVLTPHFTEPIPRDGHKPSEEDILIAGAYNLGFVALGAGPTTDSLLEWWSERLESDCVVEPERGRFVDQRWVDLVPGIWSGVHVLRDPTFNVAYWNLPTRQLRADGDGYTVNGEPLRFFHFSGFDPTDPDTLSRHQDRIRVSSEPALGRILSEYAAGLMRNGFEEASEWPYGWEATADGVRLDRTARLLHREAVERGEIESSVFSLAGAERFTDYLTTKPNGGHDGSLSRYARTMWESRPDLRVAFPDVEGRDAEAFHGWLHEHARQQDAAAKLLPDTPEKAVTGEAQAPPTPPPSEPGVNLVGYISSERGVGEAARQALSALHAAEVPTALVDAPVEARLLPEALGRLTDADQPHDFNLVCVNADMLPGVAKALGERFFNGRRTAGLWFWEVSDFPARWSEAFDHVDEVWVASEHVARALRPLAPVPVAVMRLPVVPNAPASLSRTDLGMPEGFCFLFVFDFRSVYRRKNPLGVIEAFSTAFAPGEGPSLVIKSICGDEFPAEREALAEAARGRAEIHLIDEMVAPDAKNAMIAACDCYVSLHRSEGFGLTMAEAMYFERPVVATSYSGNLDFMTASNSYLVPHSLEAIGEGAAPYPPDGEWAEPDLGTAAALMRDVFHRPEEAAERGRRAGREIRHTHSPRATGEWMESRIGETRRGKLLERLRSHPEGRTPGAPARPRERLEDLLALGSMPPSSGTGRLRSAAKRLYMRLLRPYAAYQRQVDASVRESLDELRHLVAETTELGAERSEAGDRRERHGRDAVLEVDSNLAAMRSELQRTERGLGEKALPTLDEHRSAIEDLRVRAAEADELVRASAAEPFMADDRLSRRTFGAFGSTLGFRDAPQTGGYRGFEDLFRGSEEMIRDRQRIYLDLLAGHSPVLDAGCGRGELLDLLAEHGIEFEAVDLDAEMVARCHEKGHERVEQGDMIEFLERLPEHSLGAIFSAQVIEHLELDQLTRFLDLGLTKLRPGGVLVAETVNPHSPAALKAFWVDPTHKQPLFPETLLGLSQLAGYATGDVFAPNGTGDWDADRGRAGEYAMAAAAPEADA